MVAPPRSQTYMFQSRIVPCTVFLLQVLAPRFWEFLLRGGWHYVYTVQKMRFNKEAERLKSQPLWRICAASMSPAKAVFRFFVFFQFFSFYMFLLWKCSRTLGNGVRKLTKLKTYERKLCQSYFYIINRIRQGYLRIEFLRIWTMLRLCFL